MPPSLADLRARPADRGLRAVYGDWLASQGHPRGELIAVQELARACASADELVRARARAVELIRDRSELRPTVGLPAEDPRRLWAQWDGGFVRRVELHIDRPGPRAGEGLRGWSALLRRVLAHPSLALVEALAISVQMRGEPIDETEAGLQIVVDGLAGWLAEAGPKPPLRLTLVTGRVPRADLRERLREALAPIRSVWLSLDRTTIPPPRASPIVALERALTQASEIRGRYELLWFDARGHRVHRAGIGHELGWLSIVDPSAWASDEGLDASGLAQADPLWQRRVLGLLDRLAPRFAAQGPTTTDGGHPFVPLAMPEPAPVLLSTTAAMARVAADWPGDLGPVLAALAGFGGYAWGYAEREGLDGWACSFGLGEDQVLVLAQRDA